MQHHKTNPSRPAPEPGETARGHSHSSLSMWACCAVMVLPVAYLLVTGRTGTLLFAAPLLLCAGMHVMMHGRRRKSRTASRNDPETAPLTQVETVSPRAHTEA